jgi:predicted HTH transcriptional regulator
MTGFLNSKGGTIYIGVEDKQGVVMGLPLSRKE